MKEPEWTRHKIILPPLDMDEDDAEDARVEKARKAKEQRVARGGFYGI